MPPVAGARWYLPHADATRSSELRTISHDANNLSILFRDNFTDRRACQQTGPASVHATVRPMIAAAFVSIALCAGAHAVMIAPSRKTPEQTRTRLDVLRAMHHARRVALTQASAGPRVPIQTMTIRKEDAL